MEEMWKELDEPRNIERAESETLVALLGTPIDDGDEKCITPIFGRFCINLPVET